MTCLDSLHESFLYLLHDSYRLWLIVVIISNRLLYIRGLSLVDSSPVWPHFYTVPLAQIYLCSLPYICSQGLKDSLVQFVYWISLPSTKYKCKLENAVTNTYIEAKVLLYFKFCISDLYPFYPDFNSEDFPSTFIQVELQLNSRFKTTSHTFMQTWSQAKSSSAFHSSMPSDPIPVANISKEIIVEENFLSHDPQEVKGEVDPKVEDKSSSIPVDDLVSTLRSFGKTSSKLGTIGNLREPEPFTGRDPNKLKPFLFQCWLYFWGLS